MSIGPGLRSRLPPHDAAPTRPALPRVRRCPGSFRPACPPPHPGRGPV